MEQGTKYGGIYCDPNTLEAETDGPEVQVYPGLHIILFPKKTKTKTKQRKS